MLDWRKVWLFGRFRLRDLHLKDEGGMNGIAARGKLELAEDVRRTQLQQGYEGLTRITWERRERLWQKTGASPNAIVGAVPALFPNYH